MGTKSVFPQVGVLITLMMKGCITSSQLVDSGAVMVKWAFPGERPHRRRSALGVMDRYGDTVGGLLLIPSLFGVTPGPAVKGSFRNTARPRRSPALRRRVRPLCPHSALGRPLTAGSGVGVRLPALDGGSGGARGAPPAIDQVTAEVKASGATLSSTTTRTRWSQRGRFRPSGST